MTVDSNPRRTTPARVARPHALAVAMVALPASVGASEDTTAYGDTTVLAPVEVSADSLFSRTESQVVQPVTVLEGDALERRREGTVGETLDDVPGISNADFGPGVGRPVIRGLQGSRVTVLEDGMRTSDVSGEGVDHVVANDPLRAQSIEYLRGPATLLYGSGASGGVVNVVTGRFSPVIGDRVSGSLQGSFGDNGNDRRGSGRVDVPVGEGFALRGDVNVRRTDDFDIKGFQTTDGRIKRGTLVNSDVDTDSYSLTGMWSGQAGYLGIGYSRYDTEYGVPEPFDATTDSDGSDELERIFADYDRFDIRGELYEPLPGLSSARLNLAYTEFSQDEVEFEFERTSDGGEFDETELEAVFEQDEFDGRLELSHKPALGMTGVVGLDFNDKDFVADAPEEDEEFFIRPTRTRSTGLFSVQELPTGFGELQFGARLERVRARPDAVRDPQVDSVERNGETVEFQEDPGTNTFTPFSASIGAIIDTGARHHVRTSLTRAERAPSTEQLYAFGRHSAADTFEVGDPDLRKETYLNMELGFERHTGALRYDVTAFYNRVDDFIVFQGVPAEDGGRQRVDGEGNPDPDGEQLVFNDQADAEFYGLELGAQQDLDVVGVPVTLRGTGDLVRGRFRDGGDLPLMTPPRLGVGVDARYGEFDVSVDYRRVFQQTRIGDAEERTDGYDQVGFDVGWRPAQAPGLRAFIRGRNLTNADGRRHQSFFRDSAPITGRSFTAGVRYDFGR